MDLKIAGPEHPSLRADNALCCAPQASDDGPKRVAVLPGVAAFWLQPDRPTSYGKHADPGELVCAPISDDGCFRLQGACQAVEDVILDGWRGCPDIYKVVRDPAARGRIEEALHG